MRGLFVTGCLHQTDSRKRKINLTLFSARVQVYELKITWEELAKSSLVVNNPEINNANIRFYAQRRRTLTREKNRRACFSQTSQKRTITRKQKPQNEFQTCGRTLQISSVFFLGVCEVTKYVEIFVFIHLLIRINLIYYLPEPI